MYDIIRKLLFLLPPGDKWKLAGILILMVIGSFLEVLGIGMIPVFISIVANPERMMEVEILRPGIEFMGIEHGGDMLVWGGILLVVTFLVKNLYIMFLRLIEVRFLFNRYAILADQLFNKYMNSPYALMLSRNSSEVLRNVTQETGILVKNVMTPILKIAMDFILITGTLILLFLVSPVITLAAVVVLAVAGGGLLKLIRDKLHAYGLQCQVERTVMIQSVSEGLGGLKDIRVLQRGGWFLRRFRESMGRFIRAQVFQTMTRLATKPVLETVSVTGMIMIALVLYWRGTGVDMIIPLLALFGAAAMRLLPTMRDVIEAINSLRFYGYAIHPIYEEMRGLDVSKRETRLYRNEGGDQFPFEKEIRFEDVSFSYPDRKTPAVKGLSMRIAKGEAVGFIGTSGAGKTTVVDLLLGILEPGSGRITVDGCDIRENPDGWLRGIGYVPQFIFLTDDSLRRNIALGLPDEEIDKDRLDRAIEAAQLTETIRHLPLGIDTVVGERGIRLSGGQRQRIGIARALYDNPGVLIMDEATSALDSETERYVIESIERLKGQRTIIMISHRLSTVRNCDRLFVIDNGRILDSGKCGEISARNAELCYQAGQ